MHPKGLLVRLRRGKSLGQSLAEFAIMLPVLLVVLSAAIDLGRLAYARVTIANVVREASFQAAQTPTSYQAGQPCDSANTSANLVICRAILESTGSVITVAPADITLTCSPNCNSTMGNTVTVRATGHFSLLTPVMAAFFGGSTINFDASSTNQISSLPPMPTPPPGAPTATPAPTPTPAPTTTPVPTVTPMPTPVPCTLPSAGFTYTTSPSTNKSPLTVVVTDTSSASASCGITSWAWHWGDTSTTYWTPSSKTPNSHVYYNTSGSPGNVKTFNLTLTVTNSAGSTTSGAVVISVVR
jgi:Flp pilus assembly protein TadG